MLIVCIAVTSFFATPTVILHVKTWAGLLPPASLSLTNWALDRDNVDDCVVPCITPSPGFNPRLAAFVVVLHATFDIWLGMSLNTQVIKWESTEYTMSVEGEILTSEKDSYSEFCNLTGVFIQSYYNRQSTINIMSTICTLMSTKTSGLPKIRIWHVYSSVLPRIMLTACSQTIN